MYDALLFLHIVGVALLLGSSFGSLTLVRAARELEEAQRAPFLLRGSALGMNGSIGLVLLLVSGLAMMGARGFAVTLAWGGPLFHAKLTLVVVLLGAFGYLHSQVAKAKRAGGGAALGRVTRANRIVLFVALGIVASAVLAFH